VSPIKVISGRTPGRRSRALIRIDMAELACKYVASSIIGEYGTLVIDGNREVRQNLQDADKGGASWQQSAGSAKAMVRYCWIFQV
jgi:hypothetical protein